MKEALRSSVTSVLTRATWLNVPEDTIIHSHYREKPQILRNYMVNHTYLNRSRRRTVRQLLIFLVTHLSMHLVRQAAGYESGPVGTSAGIAIIFFICQWDWSGT
jgi:hypothetical protein